MSKRIKLALLGITLLISVGLWQGYLFVSRQDLIPGDHPEITLNAFRWSDSAESLIFTVIGDAGTGGVHQYHVAEQMALAYQRKPYGLILGTGDNVYYGDLPDRIDDVLYEPYGPLLNAGVAFRPVLGNHDTSNDDEIMPIWATLGMPNRYYSFVRGPVEFFALDSNNMDADQTEWLRDHLKCSDSRWQIVYFHHPLYSSGSHGSDIILREQIESILIEGGADIVFNGHDHDYERTTPQHDIVYVVTGAGAKVTSVGTSDFTVVSKAEQHFLLIEIDDDIMTVEAISDDSEVLDTFVVSPRIAQTPCASFTKGY